MSAACAQLRLFGGIRIQTPEAQTVPVTGKKERELLVAIALDQGEPVSRDALACNLWDSNDFSARRSLNTALWRLRKAVRAGGLNCEDWFETGADYIRLRKHRGPDVDVVRLREQLECFRQGQMDAVTVAKQLSTLSGAFLPEMSAAWLDAHRRTVEHDIVNASVEAADALVAQSPNWAIELAHAAIRVDPYEERAWRAQISAYLESGRRAQAHAAYSELVSVLSSELGITPSEQTRALLAPEPLQIAHTQAVPNNRQVSRPDGNAFARRIETLSDALGLVLQELSDLRSELLEI